MQTITVTAAARAPAGRLPRLLASRDKSDTVGAWGRARGTQDECRLVSSNVVSDSLMPPKCLRRYAGNAARIAMRGETYRRNINARKTTVVIIVADHVRDKSCRSRQAGLICLQIGFYARMCHFPATCSFCDLIRDFSRKNELHVGACKPANNSSNGSNFAAKAKEFVLQ